MPSGLTRAKGSPPVSDRLDPRKLPSLACFGNRKKYGNRHFRERLPMMIFWTWDMDELHEMIVTGKPPTYAVAKSMAESGVAARKQLALTHTVFLIPLFFSVRAISTHAAPGANRLVR